MYPETKENVSQTVTILVGRWCDTWSIESVVMRVVRPEASSRRSTTIFVPGARMSVYPRASTFHVQIQRAHDEPDIRILEPVELLEMKSSLHAPCSNL